MTWTPQHNIRIAREICGYEVQTSPRGVHYVIEDGKTRPLVDFPNDPGETLTTLEAWLRVKDLRYCDFGVIKQFRCRLTDGVRMDYCGSAHTLTAAIAHALYKTLPPEAPQ